ncbi:hypothetical protein EMIT0P176_150093 [Pseudomonas sp. IT-P176]
MDCRRAWHRQANGQNLFGTHMGDSSFDKWWLATGNLPHSRPSPNTASTALADNNDV